MKATLALAAFAAITLTAARPAAAADALTFTPKPPDCAGGKNAVLLTEGQAIPGCTTTITPIPPTPIPPTAFIVAPNGNDDNPGTLEAPFATRERCQAAMRDPNAPYKTCYFRKGEYQLTARLILDNRDRGEKWANYPDDGYWSPHFSQPATVDFSEWWMNQGADDITLSGLSATGFQAKAAGSCWARNNWLTTNVGPIKNLTVTHNRIDRFDCAVTVAEITNPNFTDNFVSDVGYIGLGCNGCTGSPNGTSEIARNIVYDVGLDPDTPITTHGNGYPIALSTTSSPPYYSSKITIRGNLTINSPRWECLDNHAGAELNWLDNLCVNAGRNASSNHNAINDQSPIANITVRGNTYDNGARPNDQLITTVAMCGTGSGSCTANTGNITGGRVEKNYVLAGKGNGCLLTVGPTVTIDNPRATYCDFEPETVAEITFKGGTRATTFTAAQPGGVVADLAVTMSAQYWQFPMPPGELNISGANSGGFQICQNNKICQAPGAGTPAGRYADLGITATLHGMRGSPYTEAAGRLVLIGH